MVGSKKWFKYTTTNGGAQTFAIFLDESVTEDVNGTDEDFLSTDTIQFAIPSNITPRRAYFSNADGSRTIRATVLKADTYAALTPGDTIADPIGSGNLSLIRKSDEKIRLPKGVDTGQQDSDET